MGENSKIEWTNHTFNPWLGCTKVGPPCDNCYAEAWAARWGQVQWGPHADRKRTSAANWKNPRKWDAAAKAAGVRRKVFCASLADWLDNQAYRQWREELADEIRATPNLDWLLLSKRIQNYERLAPWLTVPANVWLGITCSDLNEFYRDWPILRSIDAPIRFISYEPALGPLRVDQIVIDIAPDWIICGGESGPKARHMPAKWPRDLLRDCRDRPMPIAFFMKQMTGKAPIPDDLMVREFPTFRESQ
jgi:protein gp37